MQQVSRHLSFRTAHSMLLGWMHSAPCSANVWSNAAKHASVNFLLLLSSVCTWLYDVCMFLCLCTHTYTVPARNQRLVCSHITQNGSAWQVRRWTISKVEKHRLRWVEPPQRWLYLSRGRWVLSDRRWAGQPHEAALQRAVHLRNNVCLKCPYRLEMHLNKK